MKGIFLKKTQVIEKNFEYWQSFGTENMETGKHSIPLNPVI